MAPGVLSSLVCVLCLTLLPAVWADYCSSYVDTNGYRHKAQECGSLYCCGDCERKYCCKIYQERQQDCHGSSSDHGKKSRLAMLLGSILGTILPIMLCVCLVICCVAPCCCLFKKCRKGHTRNPQIGGHTTTINLPQHPQHPLQPLQPHQPHQPLAPSAGYQPGYPGYQPVPGLPEYGNLPNPTAPPPYTNPAHYPVGYPAGVPMMPYPGQPYAPPPHSAVPMPYNPAYVPNH